LSRRRCDENQPDPHRLIKEAQVKILGGYAPGCAPSEN
jgi:hypothetical protein